MNLLWLLIVILIVLAVVGSPNVGMIQHGWGYYPSGGIGLVVLILIILLLLGRI
jgi:uncharacterized membrane protein